MYYNRCLLCFIVSYSLLIVMTFTQNPVSNNMLAQEYESENINFINLAGNWSGNINNETILLNINQNGKYFNWQINYYGQGLTSGGAGYIEGSTLQVVTNIDGRSIPSTGEIIEANNGMALQIQLDNIIFERQD